MLELAEVRLAFAEQEVTNSFRMARYFQQQKDNMQVCGCTPFMENPCLLVGASCQTNKQNWRNNKEQQQHTCPTRRLSFSKPAQTSLR